LSSCRRHHLRHLTLPGFCGGFYCGFRSEADGGYGGFYYGLPAKLGLGGVGAWWSWGLVELRLGGVAADLGLRTYLGLLDFWGVGVPCGFWGCAFWVLRLLSHSFPTCGGGYTHRPDCPDCSEPYGLKPTGPFPVSSLSALQVHTPCTHLDITTASSHTLHTP
jgi:hypothetical protein